MNMNTGLIKKNGLILFLLLIFSFPQTALSEIVSARDSAQREVILEKPAQRIACLYAFCGHVVTMLDKGNNMVAVVNGLKKDVLLNQIAPQIKTLPIPSKGGIIHIEALLNTQPDIVFLKPETAAITSEIKKLNRFNLPYFIAGYQSMAQQMTVIENIGKLIGNADKALAYTRYYRKTIHRVEQITELIPENKRIRLYHSVNEATRTVAPGTLEADWSNAAGVINVSVHAALIQNENKHFADIEQILIWNPDVIIVNEDGVDQQILTDKKWAPISAVVNKKVFAIPVGISRWGHPGGLETPLAILWTAKTVYPQYFADLDLKKEIKRFYKLFFNLDLTSEMVNKILSNKGMRRSF